MYTILNNRIKNVELIKLYRILELKKIILIVGIQSSIVIQQNEINFNSENFNKVKCKTQRPILIHNLICLENVLINNIYIIFIHKNNIYIIFAFSY